MKIKLISMMVIMVLILGCSRMVTNPLKGNTVIDWVDFVKLNGNSYNGSWENVIKNPSDVTNELVGTIKFKVADVVTNSDYRTKDGDAAFLEKGTKLYRIKGFAENELIAAEDEQRIGGYRIYAGDEFAKTMRHRYEDMPRDKIERIELYLSNGVKPYKVLYNKEKERFIELLDSGKDTPNYSPSNQDGDPTYYSMVFYTDEPIAYAFTLADDGTNVFFSPWDTRIIATEIRSLVQSKE